MPALRPNGATACSHGWSDAALSVAQPVDRVSSSLFFPAPEGRRIPETYGNLTAFASTAPPGQV